jgi:predicted enzyme related to lactoylglutathione lyase
VCQHAEVPPATYKDLCIDARDTEVSARFWGGLLGLTPGGPHHNGAWWLDDEPGHAVAWVNSVPEPKPVKNRVHIDVNAEGLEAALAAGASVLEELDRWTVLRDPDGQEFCIFVRETPIERRLYELVVDSGPGMDQCVEIARWWGEVLGAEFGQDEEQCWIENVPGAPFEGIVFGPVPEPKTVKNRVHIDVETDDLDVLVAHGARVLRKKGDDGIGWTVLADPDGNEFCAFTPD